MERRIRQIGVAEGYALWAGSYDDPNNALIVVEEPRVMALLVRLPAPQRVLDVATGTGRYALHLARQGCAVVGIDPSPQMLAVARRRARDGHLPIEFVEGTIEEGLPFPDCSFDLVICALVLCHIADLAGALAGCARVVRPGGHLLVTDFHPEAIERGWRTNLKHDGSEVQIANHLHTRAGYLDGMRAAGCAILHVDDIPVRESPRSLLPPDPDAFLREHGDWNFSLIVLGEREA